MGAHVPLPDSSPRSSPHPDRHARAGLSRLAVRYDPRRVIARRAQCCVLKAVRKIRCGVRFFWLVVEVSRLLAAVAILKLQCSYKERASMSVNNYRWAPVDVAQKELFNGPKPRLNVVTWRSVSGKSKSLEGVKWRLLIDLRLLAAGWIGNHEYGEAWEAARELGFQKRLKKLFDT